MTAAIGLIVFGAVLEIAGICPVASPMMVCLWDRVRVKAKGIVTSIARNFLRLWIKANGLLRHLFKPKPRNRVIEAQAMIAAAGMLSAQVVHGYTWNDDSYQQSLAQLREFIESLQDQINELPNRLSQDWLQAIAQAEERLTTTSSLRRDLGPLIRYVPFRDAGVACLLLGVLFTVIGNIVAIING